MGRYIVSCRKIRPENRDVYRAHASGYEDIQGGGDEAPSGSPAVYAVELDPEGVAAFTGASNLRSIEPDVRDYRMPPVEALDEVASLGAYSLASGVESGVLSFHGLYAIGREGYHGQGVIVGVGDTGVGEGEAKGYFEGRIPKWFTWHGNDPYDRQGHGRWVCGAAAPSGAELVPLKVLGDDGSGMRSQILAGIYAFVKYCRERRRPGVLNLSLGGPGFSQAYEDAIREGLAANVVTCAAAGNEGPNAPVGAPANSPSAVCVAAYDHRNRVMASFSSAGPEVDVCAAGVRIGGFGGVLSGTSMATPLVSRVVACLLSTGKDSRTVAQALRAGAVDTRAPAVRDGSGNVKALRSYKKLGK